MIAEEFITTVLSGAAQGEYKSGLPGAVMIAQVIQETGYGKYITKDKNTGRDSHNLFNIKGAGSAGSVLATTYEYQNGQKVVVDAYFRAYHNYQESFEDYVRFIFGNSRYAPAIAVKGDPIAYAQALYQCGYATDPSYAVMLIALIKQWNLVERVNVMVDEIRQQDEIPSPWAVEAVEKAKKSGVMIGDEKGLFHPHQPATREELAVVLNKLGLLEPKK